MDAAWEYSVPCPPGSWRGYPERNNCIVILLARDEPATVTISTAQSTETVTVEDQYRYFI